MNSRGFVVIAALFLIGLGLALVFGAAG